MATEPAPTTPVSPKVTASTAVTLLASLALAILNGVAADSSILGGLPSQLQFILLLVIPPLATFAAGWATRDPRRV